MNLNLKLTLEWLKLNTKPTECFSENLTLREICQVNADLYICIEVLKLRHSGCCLPKSMKNGNVVAFLLLFKK